MIALKCQFLVSLLPKNCNSFFFNYTVKLQYLRYPLLLSDIYIYISDIFKTKTNIALISTGLKVLAKGKSFKNTKYLNNF